MGLGLQGCKGKVIHSKKREGIIACGMNDLLSVGLGFLLLRKSGINAGINGRMERALHRAYYDFRSLLHHK